MSRLAVILAFIPVPLVAAPPALTALYPAGAQVGQTVEVTASGTLPKWPLGVHVEGDGLKVEPSKAKGKLTVTVEPEAEAGVRWIRLSSEEGVSEAKAFVVGYLPEVMEKEPNNDYLAPHVLASNAVVNGKLQANGDVDTFSIEAKKGSTLVASLVAERTLGSPMDAIVQVVSPKGFVLDENHDTNGLDPQVAFPVTADGVYSVRVYAFPSQPNSSIRFAGGANYLYRLTVTTGPFVDHPHPLAASKGMPVTLRGWNLPKTESAIQVDSDGETQPIHLAGAAGLSEVRIVPAATTEKEADAPQPIDVPTSITGRMDTPGDIDTYRFTGKKGQRIDVRADSQSLGHGLDLGLRLLDAKDKQLASADDRSRNDRDATLATTLPADGEYRIEVRDHFDYRGFRPLYLLDVSVAKPGYSLGLATDRFVLKSGKTVEIPVTISRERGHRDDIELSVEGLPAGVSAKPVTANAKAKSVKLVLTGKSDPIHATITIIGKSKTGEPRRATAARPANSGRSSSVWLSVVK